MVAYGFPIEGVGLSGFGSALGDASYLIDPMRSLRGLVVC
jgi:hypothetical protein